MKYVIEMKQRHNGVSMGFRGPNDKIVTRPLATRYNTHDGASREAECLMQDNAENLCEVVAVVC